MASGASVTLRVEVRDRVGFDMTEVRVAVKIPRSIMVPTGSFTAMIYNCRVECYTAPLQTDSSCHSAREGHLLPGTDSTLSTGG